MENTKPSSGAAVYTASIFIIIAGILLLMLYGQALLMPIVVSAFLSMLMFPMVSWLERKRVPRILSITIAMIIAVASLAGIIWFFTEQIRGFSNDLADIQTRFEQLISEVNAWVGQTFGIENAIVLNELDSKVIVLLQENASSISNMAASTLGTLTILVLIPVYMFMFLLYRDHFTQFVIRLFSNEDPKKVIMVVSDLRRVIQNYISGVLKVMAILATLNAIAFFALGIKHALFFAVFAAILNIVPYVGPLIGSVIPITYALLTKDSIWYPIGVFISFHVIQTIEGNFLTPKIVGSNVSLNPVTSLIALLLGGYIWGVAGMILFIPMFAILKKILELHPKTSDYGFLMGEEDMELRKHNSVLVQFIRDKFSKNKKEQKK